MRLFHDDESWELWCPGRPDCLQVNAQGITWSQGSVLFWSNFEGQSRLLALPGRIEALFWGKNRLIATTDSGFYSIHPDHGHLLNAIEHPIAPDAQRLAGQDFCLAWSKAFVEAWRIEDGRPLPLPETLQGAQAIAIAPQGYGFAYSDPSGTYLSPRKRIAPPAQWLHLGPQGRLICGFPEYSLIFAPDSLPQKGPPAPFFEDGPSILNHPYLKNSDFSGSPPAQHQHLLAGPGLQCWDLHRAQSLHPVPEGLLAWHQDQLYWANDTQVGNLQGPLFTHTLCEGTGDRLAWMQGSPTHLTLGTLDGEIGNYHRDGYCSKRWYLSRRHRRPHHPVTGFPLPLMGEYKTENRHWGWTETGLLLSRNLT